MKVLVTGASGFVGKPLCEALIKQGAHVYALVRNPKQQVKGAELIVHDLNSQANLKQSLKGVDVVIHLAGRAHVMSEHSSNPYEAYYKGNVSVTETLAKQAALSDVKRFIYLSSVKVNGEFTFEIPFVETDSPKPEDDYGKTKLEAEEVLKSIGQNSNMEIVIIRPPLVYGPSVKANFKALIKLAKLSIPLPFGAIQNKRSLIYVENLIDFIINCLNHPNAVNQVFLVSDDQDVSTTQLIKLIKLAYNKISLLVPFPHSWLCLLFRLIGKPNLSNRLCRNLQVDITKAKDKLDWKPPYSVEQGILKTVTEIS